MKLNFCKYRKVLWSFVEQIMAKYLFERSLASKLSNTPKMIFISHLQPLQISNKAKFHAFFWEVQPFKAETFYKMNFYTQNVSKKHAQAQSACPSFKWKEMLFGNILSVKIHFVKSQGKYLESGLVSALHVWTSQKMREILLYLNFEAVVDVIWKSFLVCLVTWMLNFCLIKHFSICSTKLHRTFLNLQKFNFMFLKLSKIKDFIFFYKL